MPTLDTNVVRFQPRRCVPLPLPPPLPMYDGILAPHLPHGICTRVRRHVYINHSQPSSNCSAAKLTNFLYMPCRGAETCYAGR